MAEPLDRQHDEIESLKSIYDDIFTDVTPSSKVWNRNASPHFQISLQSHENADRPVVSLVLDINFTPTYPLSSPIVKVLHPRNILRARLTQIDSKIDEILKEYLGEEVCFTIIMDVKEMLDDFQQTTEQVLSLEEERVKRIEKERELLEQREKEVLRKEQSAKMKKSREANRQILQMNSHFTEESRGSDLGSTSDTHSSMDHRASTLVPPPSSSQVFTFDNILSGEVPHTNSRYQFQAVQGFINYDGKDLLSGISKQYIVKPYLPPVEQARLDERNLTVSYLLTVVSLNDAYWSTIAGKSDIRNLELELESVMSLNSDSLLKVIGFQIDQDSRNPNLWTVRILTDFESNQQSIVDILSTAGSVNWSLARTWLIQLLPAVEYLHNSGLTHGLICIQSVILCDQKSSVQSSEVKVIKLCHPTYGLSLLRLSQIRKGKISHPHFTDAFIPRNWMDPDLSATMARTDIWQLGVLFMRIMLDFNILETDFPTPEAFLHDFDVRKYSGIEEYSERVYDLIRKMVQPKASKRSNLLELNAAMFFRADFNTNHEITIENATRDTSVLQSGDTQRDPIGSSRYQKSTLDAARRNINPSVARRFSNPVERKSHVFNADGTSKRTPDGTLMAHNDSQDVVQNESRYAREFEEVGKLGKGGFGEVVKARNRMEGTFYAIKKIKHKQNKLENLLNEVFSLARLNHQYIVRYYGCWVEEISQSSIRNNNAIASDEDEEDGDSSANTSTSDLDEFESPLNARSSSFLQSRDNSFQVDYFTNSVASLDYDSDFDDRIVFANSDDDDNSQAEGNDDGDDDDDDDDDEYTSSDGQDDSFDDTLSKSKDVIQLEYGQTKSQAKSVLYIQMEFCENNTLLDLIEKGLPDNANEYWRLFRQILEAVSYIHSSGFIHRDLKPTNIFIDKSNNIKVGDFGLAKNSQFSSALSQNNQVSAGEKDLSTVVGTFFYTAKEVATGQYDEKVDMYSLGIIFFEMCYKLGTGMERAVILNNMRLEEVKFPSDFSEKRKSTEKKLIGELLSHNPKKRPGASELLQSGLLPVEHQDVVIKEALKSLADPASPWQQQVRETLFNQPYSLARDIMFDRVGKNSHGGVMEPQTSDYLIFSQTLAEVLRIFKNHGALQEFSGSLLIPKSSMQTKEQVYELLDRSGSVLTLTYDLVLPLARFLSRENTKIKKCFTHEFVYRPNLRGTGKPDKYSAVAFDVFSHNQNTLVSDSAECIKAADEIMESLPCFKMKNSQSHVVINHMDILNSVIDFAFGISHSLSQNRRYELMGILSQLGVERGAEEIKAYLRNDFKIQHTVVKDLVDVFNFTVEPEKAKLKLRKIMVDSPLLQKVENALDNLTEIIQFARKLGVRTNISFCPLSNYNAKYYEGDFMFQVIYRIEKNRKFSRVATGGRYDSLIEHISNEASTMLKTPHAVGFQLTMTLLFLIMKNSRWRSLISSSPLKPANRWKAVRCDVLLVSLQESIIKDSGFELLGDIWAHDISCDWFVASSYEDMMNKAESDGCNWIIHLKQPINHGRRSKKGQYKPIRVRNVQLNKDIDLDYDEVLVHLKTDINERDAETSVSPQQNSGASTLDGAKDISQVSHRIGEPIFSVDIDQKVVVVPNLAKGKKSNKRDKWELENDSKLAAAAMIKELAKAPILTVDSTDAVLDMISSTSLLVQQEEWLKRAFATNKQLPRNFGVNIYETLKKEADRGTRWVVLHSPKTDKTTIVDLQK
ncbi:hypothetical protein JCM33374_g6351 [Metschnikowia sp. JCM 33374]|nr:hypothetical protein JCM33374_g6351 [Metschnikowia sp. JCM 33374]